MDTSGLPEGSQKELPMSPAAGGLVKLAGQFEIFAGAMKDGPEVVQQPVVQRGEHVVKRMLSVHGQLGQQIAVHVFPVSDSVQLSQSPVVAQLKLSVSGVVQVGMMVAGCDIDQAVNVAAGHVHGQPQLDGNGAAQQGEKDERRKWKKVFGTECQVAQEDRRNPFDGGQDEEERNDGVEHDDRDEVTLDGTFVFVDAKVKHGLDAGHVEIQDGIGERMVGKAMSNAEVVSAHETQIAAQDAPTVFLVHEIVRRVDDEEQEESGRNGQPMRVGEAGEDQQDGERDEEAVLDTGDPLLGRQFGGERHGGQLLVSTALKSGKESFRMESKGRISAGRGGFDVELVQDARDGGIEVRRRENFGNVGSPGELQPVRAAGMMRHKVLEVVELVVDPPKAVQFVVQSPAPEPLRGGFERMVSQRWIGAETVQETFIQFLHLVSNCLLNLKCVKGACCFLTLGQMSSCFC